MHFSLPIPYNSDTSDSPRNAGSDKGGMMYGTTSLFYFFLGGIAALGQVSCPSLLTVAFDSSLRTASIIRR